MPTNKKKARGKKQKKEAAASKGGDASSYSSQRTRAAANSPFTGATQSELAAVVSPAVVSSAESDPVPAPNGATCWICLEGPDDDDDDDGNEADAMTEPLRRNCACRGESAGYAHLSCLASYAASRSEEIWTGKKKAAENTNQLAFGRPWESCAHCKQYYAGQLRIDLAYEFARSTEGMVGGIRAFRHVTARSWITKSVTGIAIPNCDFELCRAEFEKLIDLTQSQSCIYGGTTNQIMGYLRANLQQTEAETNNNYALFLFQQLLLSKHKDSMPRSAMKKVFQECCNASARSTEGFEALKFTILYQDTESGAMIDNALVQTKSQLAQARNEFSYLNDEDGDAEEHEQEMLELSEKVAKASIEERGEGSSDAIKLALRHGQNLMTAMHPPRPFEAHKFLMDTLVKSRRTLGPNHELTKCITGTLEEFKAKRKGAYYKDPDRVYYPVDRFDEDADLYIMDMAHRKGGGECGWAPSDLILMPGALVACVDLKGAKHLNGKEGWIEGYDDSNGRHMVEFEDTNIRPCLVKPVNLRLVFFDEES